MIFSIGQSEKINIAGNPEKSSCIQRRDRKKSSRVTSQLSHLKAHLAQVTHPGTPRMLKSTHFFRQKDGFPGAMPGSLFSLKPNSDLPAPCTPDIPIVSQKGAVTFTDATVV